LLYIIYGLLNDEKLWYVKKGVKIITEGGGSEIITQKVSAKYQLDE